jgi:hypothetical protein
MEVMIEKTYSSWSTRPWVLLQQAINAARLVGKVPILVDEGLAAL